MPLPHGRNGLITRRMAVLYTFRAPSLCRHVHRELLRSVLLDLTPIISATACHQRNYVERYSRYMGELSESEINSFGTPPMIERCGKREKTKSKSHALVRHGQAHMVLSGVSGEVIRKEQLAQEKNNTILHGSRRLPSMHRPG